MPLDLDATDWRILKALQANGRISNVDLAALVGITPPPCLRRVRALEQSGIIRTYMAQLDEVMAGFQVSAFAQVRLHRQADSDLRAFEDQVMRWPHVREAHMLAGEADYMLRCVAPDLPSFQDFVLKHLATAANVASVKTSLAIRRSKVDTGLPLDLGQRPR